MLPLDYFKAIHGSLPYDDDVSATIALAKMELREELTSSVNYVRDAKRNGKRQGLIITPSATRYKSEVEALPDDPLYPGDIIECYGEHWIVQETRVASPFQTIGVMWLCNLLFRWQNGSSRVIERWGVLDSGVYSTTKDGDEVVMTADKQFKIYLPFDDDTSRIYVDKRLATETMYDKDGNLILGVQEVTGFDSVSRSYGKNAHLLILNSRSADFVPGRDNVAQMICDYISEDVQDAASTTAGTISGRSSIRLGVCRQYTADFNVLRWELNPFPSGVSLKADGNTAIIMLGVNDELVGETLTLTAVGVGGSVSFDVEVTV